MRLGVLYAPREVNLQNSNMAASMQKYGSNDVTHHGSTPHEVLVLEHPLTVVPIAALLLGGVGGGECACCFWN